ncbi:efflux RND transporter permease subunit [Thioalkalivibrio sp. ALE17]|uniref:efflux RND transporter permease subunit n=1 Tax=Thioalkalivibrio sp. ALE17 TaxID=1158173 RepID=UPI00048B18E5|nr:efflux RND transporter permease subunit [Thioalkalivibrio sp. ALE17]
MADAGDSQRPHGRVTSFSIRRPVAIMALASVVIVLGMFFVDRLPVDLLPHVEYPHIRVTVNHPGTAPEVMEEQVTRVLERNLAATENLTRIYSRASEGRTNVNLLFEYGTNLDLALQDAARHLELARTQLPDDFESLRLYKFDPSQDPIWEAGFSSTVRSETAVRDWVEHELAPQLIAIHGISSVEASGGQQRELEVILDQERVRGYGLSMAAISETLADENREVAGGWVTSDTFDVMAKTEGLFTSEADVRNVLIPLPGPQSAHVRLGELAEVRDGHREQRLFIRLDGTPAARVSVFKLPEANTVESVDAVRGTLQRLERSGFIPEDIQWEVVSDSAPFIRGAVSSVGTAAVLGGVLAMLAVFLFLGSLRKSFIIGLSIPIALMATFAMMGLGGLTLNIISLGGLALGVGLLLDNAIVMLENIYRHRDKLGKSPEQAAHDGAGEVVSAVTAGTLTNLAAVLPFLLITGIGALIFRELILTLSFAIIATLAAAITLVPMLAALLARIRWESGLDRTWLLRGFDRGVQGLRRRYRRLLPKVLRARWVVLGAAGVLLVGAIQVGGELGTEFLPQVDDGQVSVRMVLPPGTPPHETDAAARDIEAALEELPHVESVFAMVGGHLGGGVVNERPGTSNLTVQLTPAGQREMTAGQWVAEAQAAMDELDLPGARITVRPPRIDGLQFSVTGDDLSIGVVGADLTEMRTIAREIAGRLEGIPGLEGVEVGREDQSPILRVHVDRERAAALGLQVGTVGQTIRDAVEGAVPTQYVRDDREYDLRVRLPREDVQDTATLGRMILFRDNGDPVRLADVAEFEIGEGPAHIERENQSRVVRVNGDINTEVSDVGSVMAEVEQRLAEVEVPEHYSLLIGGEWETIQETQREMATVVALAIFLVLVVLAVQYERLANPLVIVAAAPLSLIGVVAILWATNTPVSAPVMIGAILLIGVVVNNAILLVEYIEQGRRRRGLSPARAVVEAGALRLRPILMTTLTTVLGMLPLAIGLGEGAEIMRPLALTVVGGLIAGMILTLLVVPCLYLVVNRAAERVKGTLATRSREPSDMGAIS